MLTRLKQIHGEAWRDAARAALQGAAAAMSTFLLMRQLQLPEIFVGILSAVFILQPSIGGTAKSARSRLVATLVGTVAGLTTFLALPYGVGTALALGFSVFLVSGIASLRPDWTYGLVAAVGVSLASEQDAVQTATDRAIAIALGASLGLLTSFIVWPERSRTRREKHFRRAVQLVRDRVDDAVATAAGHGEARASEIAPRYHREMALAREADDYSRPDAEGTDDRLAALSRLYNATIVVDRADEALSDRRGVLHDLEEPVREVREALVKVLDQILKESSAPQSLLRQIDRTLTELADRSIDAEGDAAGIRARLSLVFGLEEIRASLSALLETLQDSHD